MAEYILEKYQAGRLLEEAGVEGDLKSPDWFDHTVGIAQSVDEEPVWYKLHLHNHNYQLEVYAGIYPFERFEGTLPFGYDVPGEMLRYDEESVVGGSALIDALDEEGIVVQEEYPDEVEVQYTRHNGLIEMRVHRRQDEEPDILTVSEDGGVKEVLEGRDDTGR